MKTGMSNQDSGSNAPKLPEDIAYVVAAIANAFGAMHRDLVVAKAKAEASSDPADRETFLRRVREAEQTVAQFKQQVAEQSAS